MKRKYALVSVSNPEGLEALARTLIKHGYTLIASGGTAKKLAEWGIEFVPLQVFTGFDEILDGRVKTLHPKVHAGLLFLRGDAAHEAKMTALAFDAIDIAVVNFYPFQATVAKADVSVAECIANIDIGGPGMLRSGAKNHKSVTVVVDPEDYAAIRENLDNHGVILPEMRVYLARRVFEETANYDSAVADWMLEHEKELIEAAA